MTRTQRWRAVFVVTLGAALGFELAGVADDRPDDTITETLIAPLVNWDVAGFPAGWTAGMGMLVWLGVHAHRKRRKGI